MTRLIGKCQEKATGEQGPGKPLREAQCDAGRRPPAALPRLPGAPGPQSPEGAATRRVPAADSPSWPITLHSPAGTPAPPPLERPEQPTPSNPGATRARGWNAKPEDPDAKSGAGGAAARPAGGAHARAGSRRRAGGSLSLLRAAADLSLVRVSSSWTIDPVGFSTLGYNVHTETYAGCC